MSLYETTLYRVHYKTEKGYKNCYNVLPKIGNDDDLINAIYFLRSSGCTIEKIVKIEEFVL